jgi:hypothetical protein
MCVETKPRIELLFQDVDDIFLQDLEDPEDPILQDTYEYRHKPDITLRMLNYIMIFLPYSFIIQPPNDFPSFCYTLIYGMIITINQLHNKTTINYWIFLTFIIIRTRFDHLVIIYTLPFLVQSVFKNNNIIAYLVEQCGIILGHHIYWSLIIWAWLLVSSYIYDSY